MITFKSITFKNLLSVGNVPVTINLDTGTLTLISGENGVGKSTIIDSIVYAIYGSPYRPQVKLADLINNKNKKNLLTELVLEKSGHEYKIIRGMKPNKLEIYKDGEKLKSNSNVKLDQKQIINDIIPYSKDIFISINIIGKANYIPFMDLSLPKRREFLEMIFEMSHLGKMKSYVRQIVTKNEKEQIKIDSKIENIKTEISYLKKMKKESEKTLLDEEKELKNELSQAEMAFQSIKYDKKEHDKLKVILNTTSLDLRKIEKKYYQIQSDNQNLENSISKIEKQLESDLKCTLCGQSLPKDNLEKQIKDFKSKLDYSQNEILEAETKQLTETIEDLQTKLYDLNNKENQKDYALKEISKIQAKFEKLENRKAKLKDSSDSFKLKDLKEKLKITENELKIIKERLQYLGFMNNEFLADSGFKTYLLSRFRPELEVLIEKNFSEYGLPNRIEIKSDFNMKLINLLGEELSYGSFSEGQKQRINLSIWGAFTDILKTRHNIQNNLIFFDEILDSSLDVNGKDVFMHILKSKIENQKLSAFIISHSMDNFENNIKVTMKNGFSKYENT